MYKLRGHFPLFLSTAPPLATMSLSQSLSSVLLPWKSSSTTQNLLVPLLRCIIYFRLDSDVPNCTSVKEERLCHAQEDCHQGQTTYSLWPWKVLTVFTKNCRISCYSVLFTHQYNCAFFLPKYVERCLH